jgi:sortase (surface protein transpeptidase)
VTPIDRQEQLIGQPYAEAPGAVRLDTVPTAPHHRRSRSSGSNKPLSLLGGLLMMVGLLIAAGGIMLVAVPTGSGLDVESSATGDDAGFSFDDLVPDWVPSPFGESTESTTAGAGSEATVAVAGQSASAAGMTVTVDEPTPVGIRIPAIGVDASMIPLGLRPDRTIEVPKDFAQTGWWVDGPEPGEPGPAVVLGHVDSRSGPAVFFDLRYLQPGDEVVIDRADGTTVTYRVDRLEQHPKDEFPTEAVYGPTADAQLRLVTCGGDFDRGIRHYVDNIVVFATLV